MNNQPNASKKEAAACKMKGSNKASQTRGKEEQ